MHFIFVFALYAALLYDALSGRACEGCADRSFAERYTKLMPRDELCSTSYRYRWWCPATQLPARAIYAPPELSSYVGITALVAKGEHAREALFDRSGLSVLHLGPEGAALAFIGLPRPQTASRFAWETAYESAANALLLRRFSVSVDPTIEAAILADRAWATLSPVTYADMDARWTGQRPARLWESEDEQRGSVYVVVEERELAWVISVFPKRPWTLAPSPEARTEQSQPTRLIPWRVGQELHGRDEVIFLP